MSGPDEVLGATAAAMLEGRLDDPFAFLGPHESDAGTVVRTFQPGARGVELVSRESGRGLGALAEVAPGVFTGTLAGAAVGPVAATETGDAADAGAEAYVLRITWPGAQPGAARDTVQETEDPYAFGLLLSDFDLHLFAEGRHFDMGRVFGAQGRTIAGIAGVAFSVWAPNARRVSVVGDFNSWDGRRHPMRLRHQAGVWELFVPRLGAGARYKFEIAGADGSIVQKADPLARATEHPPATASIVAAPPDYRWTDGDWMEERARRHASDAPISIYEVHVGSWLRPGVGTGEGAGECAGEGRGHGPERTLDWRGLADRLIPYVADMGFSHVELMPIMEHPFGGSWGYQPLSQFAPSARFGRPEDFAAFVDACHRAGIGVILDWVPAHFPGDAHGLARFDGTHLYEHGDPREGFHQDWNSLIYNFGRHEVSGFLLASALWWLETFHVDGLRVDAVASMLYRDYSRKQGEWVPNIHGGRENLEAVAFLKQLNAAVAERCPGAMTVAEESTAWPGVSAPVDEGGLGFSYKWNMGWMHDTLHYIEREPVHRKWHHGDLTFPMVYAYSEKYMLPISHDEVVHGKGSLLARMPGDRWRQLANLRAYLAFMWTHPGKKLLFMGCELGMEDEWNHDAEMPWHLLDRPEHAGVQMLVRDLNRLYAAHPALHALDTEPGGFYWLIPDDFENSVYAFVRRGGGRGGGGADIAIALNLTPEARRGYQIGLPHAGKWREMLNTDAAIYGGGDVGNCGAVHADGPGCHNQPHSARLALPPLGAIVLRHEGAGA